MSDDLLEAWTQSIEKLCVLIDQGHVTLSNGGLLAIAESVVADCGRVAAHTLICELAARCPGGRQALRELAQ